MTVAAMLPDIRDLIANPFVLIIFIFQLWMTIDAARRQEWLWMVFNFLFGLSAILYFFMVYRPARVMEQGGTGFEWPGAADRERIRELEEQIHHLDKAHHHAALGEIYLKQEKVDKAMACYENAFQRDPEDLDILAGYGRALVAYKQSAKAVEMLERVHLQDPDHDYGTTTMALGHAYLSLDRMPEAQRVLEKVLQKHSYAQAKVQLAEIYMKSGRAREAAQHLQEVMDDDKHAPSFAKNRDVEWTRKAKQMLRECRIQSDETAS